MVWLDLVYCSFYCFIFTTLSVFFLIDCIFVFHSFFFAFCGFFQDLFLSILLCVCVCVCLCGCGCVLVRAHVYMCAYVSAGACGGEGTRSFGTRVTGYCELLPWVLGLEPRPSATAVLTLNHWSIYLDPICVFSVFFFCGFSWTFRIILSLLSSQLLFFFKK